VWALGDITGHGAFTHMSMYEARIVVADILGEAGFPAEYHAVPRSPSPIPRSAWSG
jgi:pyruvate/2-oxoglutarate dehydrogenase complex dihydrolipoamide dehydrogenase (E3) component